MSQGFPDPAHLPPGDRFAIGRPKRATTMVMIMGRILNIRIGTEYWVTASGPNTCAATRLSDSEGKSHGKLQYEEQEADIGIFFWQRRRWHCATVGRNQGCWNLNKITQFMSKAKIGPPAMANTNQANPPLT